MSATDPRTGRAIGDHGTASQAISFALDVHEPDCGDQVEFLKAWREGNAFTEWPEFYAWLAKQKPLAANHF